MCCYSNELLFLKSNTDIMTYLIRCASDCLEVEFMPLACDSILHCSVVQVVTSDVCSTSISRSLPAENHVVTDPLQKGHTGGRAWDGYGRIRLSLSQQPVHPLTVLHLLPQQRTNAHSLFRKSRISLVDLHCRTSAFQSLMTFEV